MRGDGCVFKRPDSPNWYIAYSFRGKPYQESTGSTDEKVAKKILRQRLKQVDRPNFVDPSKEEKWTIRDLKQALIRDYERKANRSKDTMLHCFKHVENAFEFHRLVDITTTRVREFGEKRLKDGAARASVNRELAYLRRGFKLMFEAEMVSRVPVIKLYDGENVRTGFLAVAEFNALLEKIPDADARDTVEFLYHSGWRSKEVTELRWSWIDTATSMARLPAEFSKNKKPRALPLTGALTDVIERRKKVRRLDCEFVFHRGGRQVKSFRRGFKAAAKEIQNPGLVPHDTRRSAVRNFRRAGLSEHEAMMLSGHKTASVFRRYDIISEDDLAEAMAKVQSHLQKEVEKRKVVPIKRESA